MIAASPMATTHTTPPVKAGNAAVRDTSAKSEPTLIVVGADKRGRWRAAWFSQSQVEIATRAAAVIGLHALPVTDKANRALAAELRQGQVFASGRALIPFAQKALHARLQALLRLSEPVGACRSLSEPVGACRSLSEPVGIVGTTSPTQRAQATAADGSSGTTAKGTAKVAMKAEARYPRSWDGIAIGSLVLITEGEQDGWYEAEVVAAKPGGEFTLQWRDWPDLPMLLRRREEMALLHPNASAAAGA